MDDDGFLYVEGRLGDVIITGGENVLPDEIEEALMRHPGVADAAAVGRSDPEWQEAVTAVVVLREPGTRRAPRSCARTAPPSSPATRSRSGSSSPTSCREPPPGSCCAGSCGERSRAGAHAGSATTSPPGRSTTATRSRRCSPTTPATATARTRSRSGSQAIAESWFGRRRSRAAPGTYDAAYGPFAVDGDRAVATGIDAHVHPTARPADLRQLLRDRFDDDGRCSEFLEYFIERPR